MSEAEAPWKQKQNGLLDHLNHKMQVFIWTDILVVLGYPQFSKLKIRNTNLWFQLKDMFQLIGTPQSIEKVMIQLKDTPSKVYAIGARLFLSKVPLEVLQNWVLIQLIVTPHILGKVQGQIKEVCRLIEPCLLIGTREYN